MKERILRAVRDNAYDLMGTIQDELGITDGAEPFDVRFDEISEELADEIVRIIEYQKKYKEIEEG